MATSKQRAAARKNVKKAQLEIDGRSKMGKAQLIRAVAQKRRSRS